VSWPTRATIYWDPIYNIPLIKPEPGNEDNVFRLRITDPGDARPGFIKDYEKLIKAIRYEFNDDTIYDRFIRNKFILLNKVPHWDQMWEIISSGNVIGQLFYDPFRGRWRFRLSSTGALIAYEENLVDYVIYDGFIRVKKIIRENYSSSSRQVIVVDCKGKIRGLAENIDGTVVVTKVFKYVHRPRETSERHAGIHDVLKYNRYGLYYFESRAKAFLYSMSEKVGKEVVVSYSGGKDSLTALHLTLETLGDAKLLFNDTGLELPDTIANVDFIADKYGLEKIIASAGNAFWDAVEIFGPPGKDYRWCCKIVKLVPLARIARHKWPSGALNVVGQRAYESIDRAKSPRVWRNRWIPHLLSITPIQEWSQLHIWLYIFKHKLPYNRLYDLGFERLGCYVCPSSTLAEFKEVERTYPGLWHKWINVLERWRKRLNQPLEWIKYGLWRWLTPAVAKQRLVMKIPGYNIDWINEYSLRLLHSKINLTPIEHKEVNNWKYILFNKDLVPDTAQQLFSANIKMIKHLTISRNKDTLSWLIHSNKAEIIIDKNTVKYRIHEEKGIEDLIDVLKIIYRIHGCARCSSCVIWCPMNVIKLTSLGPLPKVPCSGCRLCLEVCPLADVLVEKILVPLITGNVRAWKRSTKYRREEVIESFRALGLIP